MNFDLKATANTVKVLGKTALIAAFFAALHTNAKAQLPDVHIEDTTGQVFGLTEIQSDHHGPLLIALWAYWCAPCKREFDAWKMYGEDWADGHNVQVLALHYGNRAQEKDAMISAWEANNWTGELYSASANRLAAAFGFGSIPQVYLYDQAGDLVYEKNGYAPGDEIKLNKIIADSLAVSAIPILHSGETLTISQSADAVSIGFQTPVTNGLFNIFTMDGKRIMTESNFRNTGTIRVPKSVFPDGGSYVLQIKANDQWHVRQIFIP